MKQKTNIYLKLDKREKGKKGKFTNNRDEFLKFASIIIFYLI